MNSSELLDVNNRYFQMAKNAATFSDFHKQHHLGCVFVYKNKILSDGWNTIKTNPLQAEYNKYRHYVDNNGSSHDGAVHAEMMALLRCRDIDIDWKKVKVFIYREHKDSSTGMARCCPACMMALKDKGIMDIYYTTECGVAHERIN